MGEKPSIPREAIVHEMTIPRRVIRLKYSGVSAETIEKHGWNHVDETDYYGIAEYEIKTV